jgi:simple sugar transport system permease protein
MLVSGIALAVPILWAALGEVITEKAGILNIGIEGVMLIGAFVAAYALKEWNSFLLAFALAIPVGLLCGALLSFFYVRRGTDQIVTGILFNLFALGLTTVLYERYLTGAGVVRSIGQVEVPLLSKIPVVGPALFDQSILLYGAVAVALLVVYLLRGTWAGLHIRAIGERPAAGDTAGVSVGRLRSVALMLGCVLVAIGGASIILTQSANFLPGITSGQGFIALAVVILGRFRPLWIAVGAALFGISTALQFHAQNMGALGDLPAQLWLSLPYLLTILAVVVAKSSRYPAATAIPYRPAGSEKP